MGAIDVSGGMRAVAWRTKHNKDWQIRCAGLSELRFATSAFLRACVVLPVGATEAATLPLLGHAAAVGTAKKDNRH